MTDDALVASDETDDEWFSDEALAKQAAMRALPEGTTAPLELLFGCMEPRTQPEEHERCIHCGSDARDGQGGVSISKGVPWCYLCLGRGRDEDYEPETQSSVARETP